MGLARDNSQTKKNMDLFVSLKNEQDAWSSPFNLGTILNTPFKERSPFLHPDMRTLYFSSNGHGGLGGLDVYKTTRIGEGWTEWTEPVNLGKEINTTGDDWGYKISTDGSMAYFAANFSGDGEDLFKIDLPDAAKPQKVATIEGILADVDGKPITGIIVVEDLETGKIITSVNTDPNTGEYFIPLPYGKLYSYIVEADGHFPKSHLIDLRSVEKAQTIETEITIPSIEQMIDRQLAIPLNNLFFDTDKATIKTESFPELDRLVELINQNKLDVHIAGHTDNVGTAEYNQSLSEKRAEATKAYLVSHGCDISAIEVTGFGLSKPVAENSSEAGRSLNRRVEISFTGQSK